MKRKGELVVCVSIAGAHCLKIKGLRSKALTTAVWLLHVLGNSAQIFALKTANLQASQNMCKPLFIQETFPSVTWAFSFLWQLMSIEDVERILDETQESIEYQRVNVCSVSYATPQSSIKIYIKHCYAHIYGNIYVYIGLKQWQIVCIYSSTIIR